MEDILNWAVDTLEYSIFIKSIIVHLIVLVLILISLKLFISLIKQIINLFK